MPSGVPSWSLWTEWWLIFLIHQTSNIYVHSPGRSFADNAEGKGDHSYNVNAATPSSWKSDQDTLMLSSVSKMYPTDVICLFCAWDSIFVAGKCWLPCHRFKESWTMAILGNLLSSASFCLSKLFSGSVICNAALSPAKIPEMAPATALQWIFGNGCQFWYLTASSG